MRRKTVFRSAIALLVGIGLLVSTSVFAAEKEKPDTKQTIQGVLEEGSKGMTVIKMDDGQAFIVLGQNMRPMIGKTVKVTGTISKGKSTRSIVVTSFEEIQN